MPARRTQVLTVDRHRPDPEAIRLAADTIRSGRLVAFPTETVYGLGANALDPDAIHRIFAAKERPAADPLIVHLDTFESVAVVAVDVPPVVAALARRFWPGPLTLILPRHARVPLSVTAGLETVAVRVPAHPVALALLAAAALPVAAPSANLFSRPSPTCAAHVLADLDGRIDVLLDAGATDVGVESTIVDVTVQPPVVRRPGGVPLEALRELLPDLGLVVRAAAADVAQVAPGQMLRHYAPRARLTLVLGGEERVRQYVLSAIQARDARQRPIGVLAPAEDVSTLSQALRTPNGERDVALQPYGSRGDPSRCARELFASLRALDARGVDEILAIAPDAPGLGLAVRDRLMRAAEGRIVDTGCTGSA